MWSYRIPSETLVYPPSCLKSASHCFIRLNEIQYQSNMWGCSSKHINTSTCLLREAYICLKHTHTHTHTHTHNCALKSLATAANSGCRIDTNGLEECAWELHVWLCLRKLLLYLLMWNSSTTIVSLSQLKLMINTLASGRFDSNSQQCHLQRCGDARGGTEGESSAEITEPAAEAQILLWAHLSPRKARSVQSSRLMDSVCCRTVCGQYSMR